MNANFKCSLILEKCLFSTKGPTLISSMFSMEPVFLQPHDWWCEPLRRHLFLSMITWRLIILTPIYTGHQTFISVVWCGWSVVYLDCADYNCGFVVSWQSESGMCRNRAYYRLRFQTKRILVAWWFVPCLLDVYLSNVHCQMSTVHAYLRPIDQLLA